MSDLSADDGMIATQLAVLMPAVLGLIMLAVQFALWAHATQLADAAAEAAATTAALPGGTEDGGRAAGVDFLTNAGHITSLSIEVDVGTDLVTAVVTGIAPNVVPGFRWSVSAQAATPVEAFIPEGAR